MTFPGMETSPYHHLVRLQEVQNHGTYSLPHFLLVSCSFSHHRSQISVRTKPVSGRILVGGLHTASLSEQSRGRVRCGRVEEGKAGRAAAGAPGAWNVNWEDCFNKALIFANAGRGLACGATQAGGQLTARYRQQTWLTQHEVSCAKQFSHTWVKRFCSLCLHLP